MIQSPLKNRPRRRSVIAALLALVLLLPAWWWAGLRYQETAHHRKTCPGRRIPGRPGPNPRHGNQQPPGHPEGAQDLRGRTRRRESGDCSGGIHRLWGRAQQREERRSQPLHRPRRDHPVHLPGWKQRKPDRTGSYPRHRARRSAPTSSAPSARVGS